MSQICFQFTSDFVREEWKFSTRERQKHEVALSWIHHRRELHWYSKEVISQEFAKFREQVRGGRLFCSESHLKDQHDKDGRFWHFLVVQTPQHLATIDPCPLPLAVQEKYDAVVPFGTDPIALMEFGVSVRGFVYFFKSKKNRDALYKFLNDIHTVTDTSLVNHD